MNGCRTASPSSWHAGDAIGRRTPRSWERRMLQKWVSRQKNRLPQPRRATISTSMTAGRCGRPTGRLPSRRWICGLAEWVQPARNPTQAPGVMARGHARARFRARFFLRVHRVSSTRIRGGPAQLGIRDWAGLKGHGADRHLARYAGQKRAAPGEVNSHVHRHRVPKSRTWVDYNSN